MLARGEVVEIEALARQGWTISAIARHVGRDRKTVRAYLRGDRSPGQRRPVKRHEFEPYLPDLRARLSDEPDLPAVDLYRELVARGVQSYPTLTARLRTMGLRPSRSNDALTCDPQAGQEARSDHASVRRAQDRTNDVAVIAPTDPPELDPESALAVLRILLKAHEQTEPSRNDG